MNSFNSARTFFVLSSINLFFLLMHFVPEDWSWTLHTKFNLDGEGTIPAWWSTILLAQIAVSAFLIQRTLGSFETEGQKFWRVFALAFLFLSADECAKFHEHIDTFTNIKWVFVYAPAALAFFVICLHHFLLNELNVKIRKLILGGLFVYAAGALGAEFLWYVCNQFGWFEGPLINELRFVIEEGLELTGVSLIVCGCLAKLSDRYSPQSALSANHH